MALERAEDRFGCGDLQLGNQLAEVGGGSGEVKLPGDLQIGSPQLFFQDCVDCARVDTFGADQHKACFGLQISGCRVAVGVLRLCFSLCKRFVFLAQQVLHGRDYLLGRVRAQVEDIGRTFVAFEGGGVKEQAASLFDGWENGFADIAG